MSRARLSLEEMQLSAARARELTSRENLRVLQHIDGVDSSDERVQAEQGRMSEALAQQGKFDEAAGETPDQDAMQRYVQINYAVWRDDEVNCTCPDTVIDPRGQGGREIEIPVHYIEEMVYSQNHKRIMPLIRCSFCGALNVRPLPPVLALVEAARAKADREAKQ